jgi:hypothetical protein
MSWQHSTLASVTRRRTTTESRSKPRFRALTPRRSVSIVGAMVLILAMTPTAAALSYYGPCGIHDPILAHLDRSSDFTAVRGTVVLARVIHTCTTPGGSGATMVFPANIATSNTLAQLGYGRLAPGDPVGWLYTPNDKSSPLGVVIHKTLHHSFLWTHKYRFTIEQDSGQTWRYTVEDLTAGWAEGWSTAKSYAGHATAVWYGVESKNANDLFGAAATAKLQMTPLNYKWQNNTAWSTLTNDSVVNWGCVGCQTPFSWFHASATQVGGVTALNAWTEAH